ncbi:thioredoxin [Penicillium taxi]|uniref:thioredoxin n=1 Tax=Penicillium taxi TaxID=168475 RepID=UPI002545AA76|nr:thioredoxin [Penicillium taxi]KAJ5887980.1 thioredoxin [Penicillium taxi]
MSKLIEITSKAEFSSHLATLSPSALLVLYFYTPWTAFCTQMSATMSTIALQYPASDPPTISFISINAKELLDIAKEHGVSKAPSVVCLRSDQVLELIRGSDPTKVCDALNRHAGVNVTTVLTIPALKSKESNDALNARLTKLVKAAPVMLFLKGTPDSPMCRFSRRLVRILREHGIDYNYFNVLGDENVREGLKEFGDWPTFPQLWVDGELVGGLDIVREEISANPSFMGQYAVSKTVAAEDFA